MLWFTSGRAPTAARPARRDLASWIEAAQTAAQSAAQSIDAPAVVATIDAQKAVQRAREGIAEAAKQARATAAEIGDELKPVSADAMRKQVLMVLPTRRSRASRGRRAVIALAALAAAGLAAMAISRLLRRPRAPQLPATWAPDPATSLRSASGGTMTGVTDGAGLPTPRGSTGTIGTEGSSVRDAQAAMSGAPSSTAATAGTSASPELERTHPPVGLPPDASTVPATFDRDAEIRAANEGMEPPESGLPGPSTRSVADGE